ncbi:MAG: hypothetical protein H0W58_13220 [Acidobacteria bacterium]|nr:hypothetical protein [Acidobacteriota bacterium]
MEGTQTIRKNESLNITRKQLLTLVGAMFGNGRAGLEDPDNPLPPGPWDPIIRQALGRMKIFGPLPDPWQSEFKLNRIWRILAALRPEIWDVIGGGQISDAVALNPQPLPPRVAFAASLAQTIIDRAEMMREIASNLRLEGGEERGIIIVSGRDIWRFIDELCGNNFKIKFPIPIPPPWWKEELEAADFFVMAAQFETAASGTFDEDLRRNFADAGEKLATAGLAKIV